MKKIIIGLILISLFLVSPTVNAQTNNIDDPILSPELGVADLAPFYINVLQNFPLYIFIIGIPFVIVWASIWLARKSKLNALNTESEANQDAINLLNKKIKRSKQITIWGLVITFLMLPLYFLLIYSGYNICSYAPSDPGGWNCF